MTKKTKIEGIGWKFWMILFVVSIGPLMYLTSQISYESVSIANVIMYGLIITTMFASIVTWVSNSIFQYVVERRRKGERRQKKKRK